MPDERNYVRLSRLSGQAIPSEWIETGRLAARDDVILPRALARRVYMAACMDEDDRTNLARDLYEAMGDVVGEARDQATD